MTKVDGVDFVKWAKVRPLALAQVRGGLFFTSLSALLIASSAQAQTPGGAAGTVPAAETASPAPADGSVDSTTGSQPTEAETAEATAPAEGAAPEEAPPAAAAVAPAPPPAEEVPPAAEEPAPQQSETVESAESSESYGLEPAETEEPAYDGPFSKGTISLGISIGSSYSATERWIVPGINVGYYLVNGLEFQIGSEFWLGGDPFIASPTAALRYVFWMVPVIKPYLGTFYSHYFVASGYKDVDSVGGRVGAYIMTGKNSYFGGGAVYERILQNDSIFADQDLVYPEFVFAFSF